MGIELNDAADQLLAKVNQIFSGPTYQVEDFPDDPETYQFAHSNAAILTVLKDRQFNDPDATDGTGQLNYPVWQLCYLARSLRSAGDRDGIYTLLDAGRAGLKGFEMGDGFLWITREYYYRKMPGGVWIFAQDWKYQDYDD